MRTRPGHLFRSTAVALAMVLAGCGTGADDYFYRPSSVGVTMPRLAGEATYLGLGTLDARPGDTVRLEALEAAGATGFSEIAPLVRPMSEAGGGGVGAMTEAHMQEAWGFGPEVFTPLAGYEFDSADGPIEVVVRLNGESPVAIFDTLVIHFRVNGAKARTQDLKFAGATCFAATLPQAAADCSGLLD